MALNANRRAFLRSTILAGAGALVPAPLEGLLAGAAWAEAPIDSLLANIARGPREYAFGYGPLRADPDGLLELPDDFRYKVLSSGILDSDRPREARFARTLADGDPSPPQSDGMWAFPGPGGLAILVRNHEMNPWDRPAVDARRRRPYDPTGWGGTTTLWVDGDLRVVKEFASLSGTLRNCAGGPTPWGSWLSCEECVYLPGKSDELNSDLTPDVHERHGYVFEVDSRAIDLVNPAPIKPMGRFRHEGVAVDPRTGFAYLTEDRSDGLLYRFRPDVLARGGKSPQALKAGDYARGGSLEALRISGRPQLDTSNRAGAIAVRTGQSLAVDWAPIANPDPDCDAERDPDDPQPDASQRRMRTAATSTRAQGHAAGAARFSRCEGIVHAHGAVYFCSTDGGPAAMGQVWKLELSRQRLELRVETDERSRLDGPDNLCPSPNGDLLVCEDGEGDNFLVGITPAGRCYHLARNAHLLQREFAGACFSPDRRTLFVNVQQPAITFAIRGPWERRRA